MKSGFDAADRYLAGVTVADVTRQLRDTLVGFYGMLQRDGEFTAELPCRCLLCGREFANDHGLGIHIGKKHNGRKREPVLEIPAEGGQVA